MIAIIDYGMGNLRSVSKAFEAVGHQAVVTRDARVIENASHVVLPGVGAFGDCMANVERYGLAEPIRAAVQSGKPFLGICLGLQLLFEESEEFGIHRGLGIIPGRVRRFAADQGLKVPHMGWNNVTIERPCPLFEGIPNGSYWYFVHSFYVDPSNKPVAATTTDYGLKFVSSIWRDNVVACQFHPEKSQDVGLRLIKNFRGVEVTTMSKMGRSTALVGLAVLAVVGCSGSKVTTKSSAELPRYQIRTIALVPFTTLATPQVRDVVEQTLSAPPGARRSDMAISVLSNTEQPFRQTVTVPTDAGDIVTQLLWSRLMARQGITVLSPSEVANALASSATSQASAGQSSAEAVTKQLKADASLIGQVSVYQERVGGRFGASPPATVGFEAKVVAADGQVLWEGNYYEKQRPMTEDFMGFIQRHGVFVTAEELASYGVEHLLLEFPFGTVGER